jgi:cell division protein FtsZ
MPTKTAEATAAEVTPAEASADDGDDELLLGADDVLTSPVGVPPIAPPEDEDEAEAPVATTGGTLFERMSNIARGAPKAQLDENEDAQPGFKREPLDIPRFLNRQNNQ